MGYAKAGSGKSLVAGGLSAVALYYVYTTLLENPTFASTLGLGKDEKYNFPFSAVGNLFSIASNS